MAEIVEEKIESEYSGSIVGRLAKYLKPYKKEVISTLFSSELHHGLQF